MENLNPQQIKNTLDSINGKLPYYNYLLNEAAEQIKNFKNVTHEKHEYDFFRKFHEHNVNQTYYLAKSKLQNLLNLKNQYEK